MRQPRTPPSRGRDSVAVEGLRSRSTKVMLALQHYNKKKKTLLTLIQTLTLSPVTGHSLLTLFNHYFN